MVDNEWEDESFVVIFFIFISPFSFLYPELNIWLSNLALIVGCSFLLSRQIADCAGKEEEEGLTN